MSGRRSCGPVYTGPKKVTSALRDVTFVTMGEYYSGGRAIEVHFGQEGAPFSSIEAMSDAGEVRMLGLALIQAANWLDGNPS
jgi:hypothetical protein